MSHIQETLKRKTKKARTYKDRKKLVGLKNEVKRRTFTSIFNGEYLK